jgi:hypothetical protein
MGGFGRGQGSGWPRVVALAVGIGLAGGFASTRSAAAARHFGRRHSRVVTLRQVIVRREPVVIHAITLEQLRQELRRARLAQVDYERQIAAQYQTIRRLQSQLDARLRDAGETNARRASQLDGQLDIILQTLGLVIFAIIGSLLLALFSSYSREAREAEPAALRPAADWDPLQHRLREAKDALATVEARLRLLEMDASH